MPEICLCFYILTKRNIKNSYGISALNISTSNKTRYVTRKIEATLEIKSMFPGGLHGIGIRKGVSWSKDQLFLDDTPQVGVKLHLLTVKVRDIERTHIIDVHHLELMLFSHIFLPQISKRCSKRIEPIQLGSSLVFITKGGSCTWYKSAV